MNRRSLLSLSSVFVALWIGRYWIANPALRFLDWAACLVILVIMAMSYGYSRGWNACVHQTKANIAGWYISSMGEATEWEYKPDVKP